MSWFKRDRPTEGVKPMEKITLVLDEAQAKGLVYLLGGRHQTQIEPKASAVLDAVETRLRSALAPPKVATDDSLGG